MASKLGILDPVIDLNRQRREREDEEGHRQRRESELDDIAWLMSEKRGRQIMFRLLEMCSVYRSSFTGNSQTFFNEGRRAVGTTLITDITEAGFGRTGIEDEDRTPHHEMEKEQND